MERHKCKLCSKVFLNGRALGGHMRSHLAAFPLALKKKPPHKSESESESIQSLISKRGSEAHQLFDEGSGVVQDRESETELTHNLTRKQLKKSMLARKWMTKSDSMTESTLVSSISETSQDEEVALCLMMLSRDVWVRVVRSVEDDSAESSARVTQKERFKSLSCKKRKRAQTKKGLQEVISNKDNKKIFECPFCLKVFGSGQALGGHKRSHLLGSSLGNNSSVASNACNSENGVDDITILDLNLPCTC
ncbi:zinc finger protein ZAT9-like [Amaranthus tricolor]|uniref:zinc finger protein ZAT9-like n=1 Tax=Amaranthus tricolor TaxID=29722 RepID=UPI002590D219|nr:zinc finger protein ZAT9-like [Amaranthus tricolor]